MKIISRFLFLLTVLAFSGFTSSMQDGEAEFVCIKNHKATNSCYYNFKIGGIPHHYRDIGCKRKKEDVIKGVNSGELGLSKEWKIPCPEVKKEEPKSESKTDF